MRTITVEEHKAEVNAQGVPIQHVAFRCPMCNTVQSMNDLIKAGAGPDVDGVEKYAGFSCVGRFTGAGGPPKGRDSKGKGCNWTLGGLFQVHKLTVKTPDGTLHARFELATPAEAQEHMRRATA